MSPRRQARQIALQALYFCEISHEPPGEAVHTVVAEHAPDASPHTRDFALELALGVTATVPELDGYIGAHAQHWRVERIALVDRLILRLAIWELQHERETPAAVIINEWLEVTRAFSSDEAVGFVNGVLDAVRAALQR